MNILGVGPGAWLTGRIGDRQGLTTGLLIGVGVAACAVVPFALAARCLRIATARSEPAPERS